MVCSLLLRQFKSIQTFSTPTTQNIYEYYYCPGKQKCHDMKQLWLLTAKNYIYIWVAVVRSMWFYVALFSCCCKQGNLVNLEWVVFNDDHDYVGGGFTFFPIINEFLFTHHK